eukprot:26305-Pyramimonas_sp.AAC.1
MESHGMQEHSPSRRRLKPGSENRCLGMGRDSTGRGGRQAIERTTAAWSDIFLSKTAAGEPS